MRARYRLRFFAALRGILVLELEVEFKTGTMKKSLNERMEEASLKELMPDFDKGAEWAKISAKLQPAKKRIAFTWQRAAAVLLLVAAGSFFILLATNNKPENTAIANNAESHNWTTDMLPSVPALTNYEAQTNNAGQAGNRTADVIGITKTIAALPQLQYNESHRTKEFVCNGTPCPLEICIIQTIHCKNQQPAAIATCNTLEPDQARQLKYKAPDGAGAQCNVTVDEIRIKRVTTGETIVLNAHSKPSTAQELFNCITGKEKCDLLAGIFESDCNNQQTNRGLKIDNNCGNLIMQ